MEQSSNNQSQTPQPPPASSNSTVPLSFIQNILANMQRTQSQVPNSTPPSNHHSHTTVQALLPDEALPQTEAKNVHVIDLDDQPIENVPASINMNGNHVGQEMQIIQQVQVTSIIEQGQIINKPEDIPIDNNQRTEKILQQEKPKETIQVSNNQISSSQNLKINSSELQRQHILQIPIEISSISQAPSISILQSVHNNQHNNLRAPSLSIDETPPAQQIANVEMDTNRSPLANITNNQPSYAFRGVSNFIDSTIPNVIQIVEQRPTPDFTAQAASNQQTANDNSENLPLLVLPNPEMEITQMDIQIPQPQPQRQPEPQHIVQQEPIVENNGQIIEIIEDEQIKLVQKIEQNHEELIQVSQIENQQVESSNIPNIQEKLTENGQKQNNILEPGEINLCEVQNLNLSQPKQIQIRQQMNQKSQAEEINHKQIVIIEDSPQEQQIQEKKPQISTNQPITVPNQLQLQFPSICNDSPQLTDINEIRKLLLTYLPPHLQELTQSLDDRQLRQMYLDIRAQQMKLSAQNVQNAPISQNVENTNNIIHIQQNPVQISNKADKPVESENTEEKKKQVPKPTQPKKVAKSNQPSVNQTQTHRRQEKKDVTTFNITQINETQNNQGKTGTDSNKKGKKMKKQRKRIVTTVVQQVEYFDDSDNEIPSKYSVLQNGETKRKKPVNKAQMQSILTQLCSLVKSLDLASIGNSTTQ